MNWKTCTVCDDSVHEDYAVTSTRRIGEADGVEYRHPECSDAWAEVVAEDRAAMAIRPETIPCGVTVGPIPKLDGAVFTCALEVFHPGDHESADGTWWVDKADPVNSPAHYRWLPNGIEVIDITETLNFTMGNAVKYILRADHKGKPIEDLEKSIWYLRREIERRRSDNAND